MKKTIDTVIFDMDGTVLNTLEDLTNSVNHVLRKFQMPEKTLEECRKVYGNGIRYSLKCVSPEGTPESVIDEMFDAFGEHYNRHCLDKTGPYEGITDLMKALKEKGYKLAIVSNKIDSAVKELNDRFFAEYVDVAIGEKPGIQRKPAPDTVFAAMKELGSSAETSVYVGDSEVDLATAENSGIPCIAVLWGFRDREDLMARGVKYFAEKPMEVFSVLEQGVSA